MSGLKRVITEIHRRSLWQVLGIYAVSSWVIYEIVVALYEGLGLPDWIPPTAFILLLIGLPIVLATAFVQEGAPTLRLSDDPLLADLDGIEDGDVTTGGGAGVGYGGAAGAPGRSGPGRRDAGLAAGPDTAPGSGDPAAAASAADVPSDPANMAATRRLFTWRRAITGGVLAFAALGLAATGFMGMRTLGIGPAGTLVAKGVLEARDPIVLADFANATPDSTLGRVVTDALRIDLVESPVIEVVDPAAVANVLERMERDPSADLTAELAREAAIREGWKAVIAGDVSRVGSGYVLTAELVEAESGEIVAGFRESAAGDAGLLDAIDALSGSIRAKVGESLKSVRAGEPLDRVTTSSLEALRHYSRGERVETMEGDPLRAASLYEEAIELDPEFAMAHRKLAVMLNNAGVRQQRQIEATIRAYELRDRLNGRERAQAVAYYHYTVTGDLQAVTAAYRNLLDRYPDDEVATNNLALAYNMTQQYAEAEAMLQSVIDEVDVVPHFNNLIWAQWDQGKVDAAWRTQALMRQRFEGSPAPAAFRMLLLALQGKYVEADSLAQSMEAGFNPFTTSQALTFQAAMDATRGRLREARGHAEQLVTLQRSLGLEAEALGVRIGEAIIQAAVLGDIRAARARLDTALADVPLDSLEAYDRPYLTLARALARAGDPERATAVLDAYERAIPPEHRALDRHRLGGTRALVALERGDPETALDGLRRAARDGLCTICPLPELGRAYESAALPDSAIAVYTRYLETRSFDQRLFMDAEARGFVLERLGELHEAAGNRDRAARYYAEFVELWNDADPELQPRVDAARRALAQLAAEG